MKIQEAKEILKNAGYLLENASLIAYHISPYKFDKFKIRSKSGMGTNFYGSGIYLTFDKNVIEHYINLMKEEYDNLYVYKVEISNTANIIDEYDIGEYITADVEEIDQIEISKTLKENGIDGVKYWNEEDGNSIVIFDENKIKIVDVKEETKDDFAVQVLEELKHLCEPFTRNSEIDPQDVFDKTYAFYKENYPELSPYKMATEMIARYRFKKKWNEFKDRNF